MKSALQMAAVLAFAPALLGCATAAKRGDSHFAAMAPQAPAGEMSRVQSGSMLVWQASLHIQVWHVSNAVVQARALAEYHGGRVDEHSDDGEVSARIRLRVPAKAFPSAIESLAELGTVTYRSVQAEDVTEQYIDVDARLKNKKILRDRLTELLEKASDVRDTLAIEVELNRVQADIDSMEGRIRSLQGQVEYATIQLSLSRKPVLGPLGCLLKGVWWGIEKLFVIRD